MRDGSRRSRRGPSNQRQPKVGSRPLPRNTQPGPSSRPARGGRPERETASRASFPPNTVATRQAQPSERDPRQSGQKSWLQQVRIKFSHAPFMLGATLFDQATQREPLEEDARLRCREVLTVICPAATLHGGEQPADRADVISSRIGAAQPAGDLS